MSSQDETGGKVRRQTWAVPVTGSFLFVLALGIFGYDRDAEPLFMDEAAFLSQSFYWDLLIGLRDNDPRWLDYPAYDLPPLPKYLIGSCLQAHGLPRPNWMTYLDWYRNPLTEAFVTRANLRAARLPSLWLGALGCVAIYLLGSLGGDRRLGILSALLLIANPLYRLHSRRAMADVPAESLMLLASVFGLELCKDLAGGDRHPLRRIFFIIVAGVIGGLAVLAKLNGCLGLMTIALWMAALAMFGMTAWRMKVVVILSLIALLLVSLATFVSLNPFITARPTSLGRLPLMAPMPTRQPVSRRLSAVVAHRVDVSHQGQKDFPKDALSTLSEKVSALAVQGYGRFGPFGALHSNSTRRFDARQDRWAVVWLPCVSLGFLVTALAGLRLAREGKTPLPWAFALQFVLALVVVGTFLPLAWDRYFMSIQPPSCIMGATALLWAYDAIRGRGRKK